MTLYAAVSVIRQDDMQALKEDEGRYLNYPVFAFDGQKLFETYRIVIKESSSLSVQPHLKGTVEYITVFAGQVEITAAGEWFPLSKGDSIQFKADVPLQIISVATAVNRIDSAIWHKNGLPGAACI